MIATGLIATATAIGKTSPIARAITMQTSTQRLPTVDQVRARLIAALT